MNKPVAWMFQGAFDISTYVSFEKPNPDIYPNPIPLYTHPVKELTDEKIAEVYKSIHGWDVKIGDKNWIGLARELLRKAQEK